MNFIIGLIGKTPWAGPAMVYALLGLLAVTAGLGACCKIRGAELETANTKLSVMSSQIETQNEAVDSWQKYAKSQEDAAKYAFIQANNVRKRTVKKVHAITVAPIPKECPKAIEWGIGFATDFGRRWEGGR